MELCVANSNNCISIYELNDALLLNLFYENDRMKFQQIMRQICRKLDVDANGLVEKNLIYNTMIMTLPLKALLDSSISSVKRVDQLIDNDLEEPT